MDLVSDSDGAEEFEWDSDGDGNAESSEFEWDSEGDGKAASLSTACLSVQTSRNLHAPGPSTLARLDSNGERDNGVASSSAHMLDYFVGMGFSREIVLKAMTENGDHREDSLLDLLLTYKVFDNTRCLTHPVDDNDDTLEIWDNGNNRNDHLSSDDSADEGFLQEMSQRDKKVESLVSMAFCEDEAKMATTRCGQDADISVLVESIYYEHDANKKEAGLDGCGSSLRRKRTKLMEKKKINGKRFRGGALESGASRDGRNEKSMPLPNPMVGFNLPGDRASVDRLLPKEAMDAPFSILKMWLLLQKVSGLTSQVSCMISSLSLLIRSSSALLQGKEVTYTTSQLSTGLLSFLCLQRQYLMPSPIPRSGGPNGTQENILTASKHVQLLQH